MSDLSQNFSWREATHSNTAERLGLSNEPGEQERENIKRCALGMEAVRSILGVPLRVTSWYRSPEVNRAVGGSPTSDHQTGWAVDFVPLSHPCLEAARDIIASPLLFDQLIYYPDGRLHISFAPAMRRDVLTKRAKGYLKGLHA